MKRSQHTNYKRWDADIYEYKKSKLKEKEFREKF